MTIRFTHIKDNQTEYVGGGLRDFFLYKDLGLKEATDGKVLAHITKANLPPENSGGTGWHIHVDNIKSFICLRAGPSLCMKTRIHW